MASATQASSVTLTISGDESHRKAYCYFIILYLYFIYLFVYIYLVFIMRQDSKTGKYQKGSKLLKSDLFVPMVIIGSN